MILERLVRRLKTEEGWSPLAYIDTTGNLTIGYGHNLGALFPAGARLVPMNGISRVIGEAILTTDAVESIESLKHAYPTISKLDDTRAIVVADMAFNLGTDGLMKWPIFLHQVQEQRFVDAAENMRGTKWYRQVGGRGEALSRMMETGVESPPRTMPHRLHLVGARE